MDLKAILAAANVPMTAPKVVEEIKVITKPVCPICAHNEHDGECSNIDCDCVYIPGPTAREVVNHLQATASSRIVISIPRTPQAEINDVNTSEPRSGSISTNELKEDECNHLCPKCERWWTHGKKDQCRYPDLINQGLCRNCLNGEEPSDDYIEKDGSLTLSVSKQIQVRNAERSTVANMTLEQLSYHIDFLGAEIEKLRTRILESNKVRAELEDEEAKDIPEEEREAFIRALRNSKRQKKAGKTKAPKAPNKKEKEEALVNSLVKQGKISAEAKMIAGWMLKTGKTQEQVEAFLND